MTSEVAGFSVSKVSVLDVVVVVIIASTGMYPRLPQSSLLTFRAVACQ